MSAQGNPWGLETAIGRERRQVFVPVVHRSGTHYKARVKRENFLNLVKLYCLSILCPFLNCSYLDTSFGNVFKEKPAGLFSFSYSSYLIMLAADRTGWNIEPKDVVVPDSGKNRPNITFVFKAASCSCAFSLFSFISCRGTTGRPCHTADCGNSVIFFIAKLTFHL